MRPGPSRTWLISKAAPFAQQDVLLRHRTLSSFRCMWPVRRVRHGAEHGHRPDDGQPGRVHRHQDLRLAELGRASGLVCTIRIMILQRGSPAPEM